MKIAAISDLHFGYASGTKLEEDAYDAAAEAFEKAAGSDIILLGGDIFDTKTPSNETLVKAMELLLSYPLSGNSDVKIIRGLGKELSEIHQSALSGIPVVSIHGTHERRAQGLLNPVQLLERAGFITYLDRNGVVFEKEGERVCVQGLSGVPDRHTEDALREWKPKPVPGCLNIFMIHQNISEFMHEKVPHTLDIAKLPKGFDFYICGHIHDSIKERHGSGTILLPGSPIPTQLTKDFVNGGGFWHIETKSRGAEFIKLERQRNAYVRSFDSAAGKEVIEGEIQKILAGSHSKKPLIRIKLTGEQKELPLKQIEAKHDGRAIISFRKEFNKDSLPEAKGIEEHTLSVNELGRKIMRENMGHFRLNEDTFEQVFELLLEKRAEDALKLLSNADNISKEGPKRAASAGEESPMQTVGQKTRKHRTESQDKNSEVPEPEKRAANEGTEKPEDWKKILKAA